MKSFDEAVTIRLKNKYNTWSIGAKESYTDKDKRSAQI
jgi:hypothetical protein